MGALYRLPRGGNNAAAGVWLGLPGVYLLILFTASWAATQYAASCFRYSPNLGAPIVWNIYYPWSFYVWWFHWREIPAYHPVWLTGLHWIGIAHLAIIPAWGLAIWRGKRLGGRTEIHGSARFATKQDVQRTGFFTERAGVVLGEWDGHILTDSSSSHVFVVAPSGTGKGTNTVVPTCLTWPGSIIVNDVKGEIHELTAGYRSQELGQSVLRFDPTCSDGTAARYNPLLAVRPHPYDVRDIQLIVEQVIDPHGKGLEKHWDRTASDLLTGILLHQLYAGRDQSIAGCLHLLTAPQQHVTRTLQTILQTEHDPTGQYGWRDSETGAAMKTHPVVAGAMRAVLNKHEEERDSVISTAVGFLSLYRDPLIAMNTAASDFDIRDLLDPAKPVSLYLTTPISDLLRVRPLARILLHQAIQRLTERLYHVTDAPISFPRLLLMIDEFPTLGKLEFFAQGLAWMRGYGVKTCLIAQDFGQVETIYGREKTLLANCDTRVAFAPNLPDTAKALSEMIGTQTVTREQRTYSGGRLSPWLPHVIATENETQRELLKPDEWIRLPEHLAVIIPNGKPPILARKLRYYANPELLRRSRIPAPPLSAVLSQDVYGWGQRQTQQTVIVLEPESPPQPTVTAIPDNLF